MQVLKVAKAPISLSMINKANQVYLEVPQNKMNRKVFSEDNLKPIFLEANNNHKLFLIIVSKNQFLEEQNK